MTQPPTVGEVADVAWLVALESQVRGVASEAARAMCARLASVGVTELEAHVHPGHLASQRVAESIGFVRSGEQDADGEDIWVLMGGTARPGRC